MNTESLSQKQIEDLQALRKDVLVYKAKAKMREKAERGIFPGCAPLGYRNAMVDGEKVIVFDEETAPKVRKLFELAAKKKTTIRSLVPTAAEMRLRSRNGKPLGASSIHLILINPFYTGTINYGHEQLAGSHAVLISELLFEEVARSLEKRRKNNSTLKM